VNPLPKFGIEPYYLWRKRLFAGEGIRVRAGKCNLWIEGASLDEGRKTKY